MGLTRRSRMEILVDILEAVAGGREKPTHILYRANLSWARLTKHLDFLLTQHLLEKTEENGAIYKITQKGIEVLEYSYKVKSELHLKKRGFLTKANVQIS